MIILLIVGCVVAALGVPIAALGVAVARMQDKGRRCAYRRPRAAVILALSAWHALRAGTALPSPAPAPATWDQIAAGMGKPIVSDREVREEFERLADERPGDVPPADPASPETRLLRAVLGLCPDCDTTDPHDHDTPEGPYRYGDGEHGYADELAEAGSVPMSPDPAQVPFTGWRVPDGYELPGGRGLMFARTPYPTAADPVTPAQTDDDPPWDVSTRQQPAIDAPVYGQAPVATVLEAQRAYVLALGPDGCEET